MPTGERGKQRLAAVTGLLAGLVLLAACDEIKDPQVNVVLTASVETIRGTSPAQIFATVTEDGAPLAGNQVTFTTSRGQFSSSSSSSTKVSDTDGLAAETLTLTDDTDTTPVEISATSSTELSMFTATLTLPVEAGGGR